MTPVPPGSPFIGLNLHLNGSNISRLPSLFLYHVFSISYLRKIDSHSQAGFVRESRSRDQKKGFKFLNNYGFQMHIEPCLFSSKEKLLIYCFFYLPQKHRKSKLIKIVSQIERELFWEIFPILRKGWKTKWPACFSGQHLVREIMESWNTPWKWPLTFRPQQCYFLWRCKELH